MPPRTRRLRWLGRSQVWSDPRAWSGYAFEFLIFGLKQGWSCLFGGAMPALKLESWEEARVILVFHGGEASEPAMLSKGSRRRAAGASDRRRCALAGA